MKKFIFNILCIYSTLSITQVFAQEIVNSPYGGSVSIYRVSENKMNNLKNSNHKLYAAISLFQKWLDTEKNGVLAGSYITASNNDYAFYKTVITDADPKYDLTSYNEEVKFYDTYVYRRKVAKQREVDSLEDVKNTAYQNKIAADKKSSDSANLVWHIIDSTNRAISKIKEDERQRIYDSTSKSNFAKEQKIRKADCVKKYGVKYGPVVANDDVVIGMNKTMVEDAWGPASSTNETLANGIHITTWQYSYQKWTVFKNGIVISVNK